MLAKTAKVSTRTYTTKKPIYKKKTSKKTNDPNKLSVCKIQGTCPVADVYNCQFHYGGYDPLAMSIGNVYTAQYILSGNNLYDPIVSGGGTQPYYYDQLIAPATGATGLYKSWKVSSSKIELEFSSASSNTVPVYVWLLPVSSDNSGLPSLPPNLDEYPRSKRLTLTSGGGSHTYASLNNYLSVNVHENITWNDWNVNDYDYQGAYSIGPTKACFWYIVAKPADGATSSTIYMRYKMTYYTELSERNQEVDYS